MRRESGRAWFAAVVLGAGLLCLPAGAQGEPAPAEQHYHALLAAGEALETWADQRVLPWPPRPVAARAVLPPEPLWDAVSARWSQAGPALRGAYARLAYLRALKTDQWLQLSGEPGTPTVNRLLAALQAPLTPALLALDDLRRFLDYAAAPPAPPVSPTLSELDAAALEAAAEALRALTAALTASAGQAPLLPVLRELGGPLNLSQMHMTRQGREMALTLPFPTVRNGADLTLVLGLLAGVATAPAPDAERVFLLLHEEGLPLAEVEIPSAGLAALARKESDLRAFWQSWRLLDYTAGAPLAATELLYPPGQSPLAGQYSPPAQVSPTQALEVIGLGARTRPGELLDAARQDGEIDIIWHDWPILGRASLLAARAALAAEMQGGRDAMHARLLRSAFEPNGAWLTSVSASLGLDAARLIADMDGPFVMARLSRAAALARLFGFRGTPSLVAGRSALEGAAPRRSLAALFALERSEPGGPCG